MASSRCVSLVLKMLTVMAGLHHISGDDCQVGSWSVCSSSCGRGTRTRNITRNKVGAGADCPSLSEDCANTNCGQIDMKAIGAVATHGPLDTWNNRWPASRAIDGVTNTGCATTKASMDPWLRVDLKTAYLIASVETSFVVDRGDGAFVRIGSDLTNAGNDNSLCGTVPNRDNGANIWTTTIVCSPSLWGRYINVQKIFPNNYFLSLCELKASYALDVAILYNDSSVASESIFVYGGDSLPFPVLCGVNPDSTNLNSLLNIQWKSGSSPISSSNSDDVRQSTMNSLKSLHINRAPLTDTTYTCQYTWIDKTQKMSQFNLNINVDCGWSTWSSCPGSCGVGTRSRTADNSVKKHQGKDCIGPSSEDEDCDTGQAPCAPTPIRNSISVQEGLPAALECEATQFRLIQSPITFEWFKNGVQIVNSSNSSARSLGNGKYKGILTLAPVTKADANSYTCKANGHTGLSAASVPITLDVTYAPFNVRVQANSSSFVKNQALALNCSAEANPEPSEYKWYKDGHNKMIAGATAATSHLLFAKLNYIDSGIYNCTAKNSVGESQSSGFEIVVDGPPGKCSKPSVTSAVGDSLEVSVSNCPINGITDVTKYKILYRMVSSSNPWSEVVDVSLPVNITGLMPYTEYKVRVAAGNQHGYGENSDAVKIRTTQGEPGPPGNVSAISLGPRRVGVKWSKPINLFGPINDYRIFYKIVRREAANNENSVIVSASKKEVNLTGLAPYTNYKIAIVAVNIRDGDNKILLGTRSIEVIVQTDEDAPSAPRDLISTPLTPNSVKIKWSPPEPANGRIRNYTLVYTKAGEKTGNKTITVSGDSPSVDLYNLVTAVKYNVWIRAVTVLPGPYKSITVDTKPETPGPPSELQVGSRTSSSLLLTWKIPVKPNGVIQSYNVYYWRLGDKQQQKSVDDSILFLNLTELRAYTNYTINVTAVNNAEDSIKEGPAATVQAQTLIAAPERPAVDGTTPFVSVEDGTVTLSAPSISDEKVPISYVRVFVYSGSTPPPSSVPQDIIDGAASDSWRVADRYTYDSYRQRQTIVVDGLEAGAQYSIYFVAYTEDDQGGVLASSSKPLNAVIEENAQQESGGISTTIIIVVVVVIVVLIIVGIILAVIIVKRRHTEKENYEMSASSQVQMSMSSVKHIEDEDTDSPSMTAPVITSDVLSVDAYEGTTALLPCDTAGDPLPTIKWYRDGKSLPGKDTHFHQLPNGALQITALRSSDSGSYRCVASNKAGTEEQTVELTVKAVETKGRLSGWSGLGIDTPSPKTRKMNRVNSGLHAIHLDDFPDHVTAMNELNGLGFSQEFKALASASTGVKLTTDAAESNLTRNRYKNILTYDHARVILKALPGMESLKCDYVAAAYIDSYCTPNKYIASQGPTKQTSADMWRMIWGENVRSIVMLTNLVEGTKIKCHQYWPSNIGEMKNFEGLAVTLDKIDSYADYEIRSIRITLGDDVRHVKLYHFTTWPDHGVPKFATGLLTFIKRVNRELPKDSGPIVVHCSAGVGRTGTFIVIDQMLEKIDEGLSIDIFSAVTSLRTKRQEMVQGEAQYVFIHVALLEAVLCGNTQIAAQDLRSAYSKLTKKDKKDRTGFERQFLVLQTSSRYFDEALCKAGLQPGVQKKNRYSDIVPLDTQRVVLRLDEDGSEDAYVNTAAGANYINASYVDGYRRRDAFIVTQGPLKNTVDDFWKMVWEQNTFSIVNLTQLVEDEEEMCCQYWPPKSGSAQYGPYRVEIQKETPCGSYVIRKMKISKGPQIRTVCQFHFTAWPDKECPQSSTHILDMMMQVEKWQQTTGNKVITVHCNNGIGRSGVFCTLVSVIEAMKVESVIDIFYKVKALRIKRPGIVQNAEQYKFCYKALLDFTDSFDTYSNFK
ncbi:receptor-type tyrosine-protein phosphatase S-like isoform X3 [Oscarella lobularis]|uniref:receptor-type tyrosine-protein phosphatase S-like isoform X3 n=1 Tax=Oscarella lobularis TaxID=121494 RepID=UPI003313FD66